MSDVQAILTAEHYSELKMQASRGLDLAKMVLRLDDNLATMQVRDWNLIVCAALELKEKALENSQEV